MAGRVPAIARFQETWLGLPANLRGGIWILLSALFFSLTEAAVKALGRTMHPFEITFLRYLFGFLLLSPLFWRMGWAGLRSERLPLQLFRVPIACSGQLCIFYAVIHLMLAEAVAFQFGRPLFITIFAAPHLGEVVGWRRWAATVIGFLGILAIARPGQMSFDPFSLVAVAGAALFAGSAIIIRRLSTTDSANQIIFYYHAGGIVLFAVPAYLVWQTPTLEEWPLIILLCLFTTAAMFFFRTRVPYGRGQRDRTHRVYAHRLRHASRLFPVFRGA